MRKPASLNVTFELYNFGREKRVSQSPDQLFDAYVVCVEKFRLSSLRQANSGVRLYSSKDELSPVHRQVSLSQ